LGKEAILARMQSIINTAKNERRELTDEELKELEKLQRKFDELDAAENAAARETEEREEAASEAERALEAERRRTSEIMSLCRDFNIEPDEFIDGGSSIDAVRSVILEKLKEEAAPVTVGVTADEEDKFRDAVSNGIAMRAGINVSKEDDGGEYQGMSLRDIAIECLSRDGRDARSLMRMDGTQLYGELARQFYNPSAAFPAIMDNTIRKSIVQIYNEVPTTFEAWTTSGSLPDFKETSDHEYVLGGLRDFEEVPENGELKNDMPETKLLPQRSLKTYGKQFSMTRQAFINDDIGLITRIPGMYAAKAKKTIDKQVYELIFNNAKIFDGKALFHNDHKNQITTGTKPTAEAIQKMVLLMQQQTDQFGEPIYMTPQHLIVPVGYEFDLAVIFKSAQVVGSANNDINPLYNYPLEVVQTPLLNAMAGSNAVPWFMTANRFSAPGIQVDYLNGQKMPQIRRMEVPGTLGFVWDIWLDWGITARDFRGIYKNAGAVID